MSVTIRDKRPKDSRIPYSAVHGGDAFMMDNALYIKSNYTDDGGVTHALCVNTGDLVGWPSTDHSVIPVEIVVDVVRER